MELKNQVSKKEIHTCISQLVERLTIIQVTENKNYDDKFLGSSDKALASDESNMMRKSNNEFYYSINEFEKGLIHLRDSIENHKTKKT